MPPPGPAPGPGAGSPTRADNRCILLPSLPALACLGAPGAAAGGRVLTLERVTVPSAQEPKVISSDASARTWQERPNPRIGMSSYMQLLHADADTGMSVRLHFYPKGYVTQWHTHPCGHGMYVLEGVLKTHEGVYGPGSFVWFPEGLEAEHGATPETDLLTLFITNKPFDIHYRD